MNEENDIINNSPTEASSETSTFTSSKINRKKIYNKNNINNLVFYPGDLSRPKHKSALKPRNLDSQQVEVNFFRMICEIVELKIQKFRFANVRTVGTYITFKKLTHLKDDNTGHRIEIDFSSQFSNKMPNLLSVIMIMGTIKHKTYLKGNKQMYLPYIAVKTWEEWTGKINFHEFYYNVRRFRSPQVDATIPIVEENKSSSDDMSDEDFETTEFFDNLKKDGLLNQTGNSSSATIQDFEKTEFCNNLQKDGLLNQTGNNSLATIQDFEKTEFLDNLQKDGLLNRTGNNSSTIIQDFEKTEFFNNLQKDGLLNQTGNSSLATIQDFEKTEFFDNLPKDGLLNQTGNSSLATIQDFEKTEFLDKVEKDLSNNSVSEMEISLFDESL